LDKRSGDVWHSYPDPAQWEKETISGIWKHHLRAPVMVQTLDMSKFNARPQITNWISAGGTIEDVTLIEGGIRLTYALHDVGISIPVEIRVQDDYVETTIVNEGVQE